MYSKSKDSNSKQVKPSAYKGDISEIVNKAASSVVSNSIKKTINSSKFGKLAVVFISGAVLIFSLFASSNPSIKDSVEKTIAGTIRGSSEASVGACKPNSVNKAIVVRAVDGDTLEISGYCNDKIRLLYVDTPETVKRNTEVQCYGPEASNNTKKAFKDGQTIFIRTDKGATDQYGRSLGLVFNNEDDAKNANIQKSYNYELVEKGFAKAKFYSPNTTYKPQILEGEAKAKSQNIGIWKECPISKV